MAEEDAKLAKKRILIDFINHETDQFAIELKRHGWTTRALLVALASLIWLFINQAPFTTVNWQNVGLLFFSLAITIDLLSNCPSMFSVQNKNLPKEPRFLLTSHMGFLRIPLLIRSIIYIALFLISFKLNTNVSALIKLLMQIILAFNAVSIIFVIIITYRQIPIPKRQMRIGSTVGPWLTVIPTSIALVGYCVALVKGFGAFSPSDLKIAILLIFMGCVLVLMADMRIVSPMLPSLISIRRDLALGIVDIDWAATQIDIALSGMRVGDLLQENIKEILDDYDIESSQLRQLTQTLETVESFIPSDPSRVGRDELLRSREAIRALMKDAESQLDQVRSLNEKMKKSIKRYADKDKLIMAMDKRSVEALEEITKKIEVAQAVATKSIGAVEAQIIVLKEKISQTEAIKTVEKP